MRVSESQQTLTVASAAPPPYAMPSPKLWTVGTLVYTTGGLVLLFFWLLLGDFALNLRDRSVPPIVQTFLVSQKASNTLMAVLLSSLPPLLAIILGPIISYRSDRLRTRWGRRIPLLIVPTPIAAVAMVGMAFTPWLGGGLHHLLGGRFDRSTCTLAIFGVFWTIFEVAWVVSTAIFGGLINDVVPRPLLGRFFGLFRAVSLLDGMIFMKLLYHRAESHYLALLLALAGVFGFGFILMCMMVREGKYPPPDDATHERGALPAVKTYFRECYSKPYYLWCFAAFTLGAICFEPINLFSIPYHKQLKMPAANYGDLVFYSYGISLILAYPLGMLVDKFHAVRLGIVTLVLYAASTIWGAVAIHDQRTFGIALVVHTVLSGTYFTATASLMQALLPRSKFTQFASAAVIVTSITRICTGPMMGQILDRTKEQRLDQTCYDYRLTFVAGFIIASIAAGVLFVVYRKFMALGGPKHYVAPGDVAT